MPYTILRHMVLLFPALRDTVPFKNQFLEIRFFSIFCMSLNQGTMSAITSYIHFKRSKSFSINSSKIWLLKCCKIKRVTVRKSIMGSLGKSPKMLGFFFLLLRYKFSCCCFGDEENP